MIYHTLSLQGIHFGDIHACFALAFNDYAVKSAVMDERALRRRARKNEWARELSVGVRAGDDLVAISLTGLDRVGDEPRAYDICTGVIPAHRGRGVAGLLIDEITQRLARAGIGIFQLEVLQNNKAGIRAYEKAGFTVTRGLVSRAGHAGTISSTTCPFQIKGIVLPDLLSLTPQLEFEPSFEQRDKALALVQDDLTVLGALADGECIAAVAYDPVTSWIMRLVTRREFRRRGAASALLTQLARRLPSDAEIKAVNIDSRDEATLQLMRKRGLNESISQWEMRRQLGNS